MNAQAANEADVLVIGAGASGAALTWRLAQAGVRVICLEQGDYMEIGRASCRERV